MSKLVLLAGERKENETDRAVQACNDYLRMGPGRSLSKLLTKYTKVHKNTQPTESFDTLKRWSAEFDWRARASAYDAEQDSIKNEKRRKIFEQGIALDYERVTKLKRLAGFLEKQIFDTLSALEEIADSEPVSASQPGFENYKVWLPDVKQVGSGEFAERVDIVRFNAPLISEYRAVFADLAAETGGRRQKVDHTVNNFDYSKLTDEQLERIVAGEDPIKVILSGYISSTESQG